MKLENLIQNGREKLNSKVKELGNKIKIPIVTNVSKGFPEFYREKYEFGKGYRFGDLLTAKINFGKAGTMAGVAAPWLCWYAFFNIYSPKELSSELSSANAIFASLAYIMTLPVNIGSAALGYIGGKQLDHYLKDKLKKKK